MWQTQEGIKRHYDISRAWQWNSVTCKNQQHCLGLHIRGIYSEKRIFEQMVLVHSTSLSMAALGLTSLTARHPISDHEEIKRQTFYNNVHIRIYHLNQTNASQCSKITSFVLLFYSLYYAIYVAYINKLFCTVCKSEFRQTLATMCKFTSDRLFFYIYAKTYHTDLRNFNNEITLHNDRNLNTYITSTTWPNTYCMCMYIVLKQCHIT